MSNTCGAPVGRSSFERSQVLLFQTLMNVQVWWNMNLIDLIDIWTLNLSISIKSYEYETTPSSLHWQKISKQQSDLKMQSRTSFSSQIASTQRILYRPPALTFFGEELGSWKRLTGWRLLLNSFFCVSRDDERLISNQTKDYHSVTPTRFDIKLKKGLNWYIALCAESYEPKYVFLKVWKHKNSNNWQKHQFDVEQKTKNKASFYGLFWVLIFVSF